LVSRGGTLRAPPPFCIALSCPCVTSCRRSPADVLLSPGRWRARFGAPAPATPHCLVWRSRGSTGTGTQLHFVAPRGPWRGDLCSPRSRGSQPPCGGTLLRLEPHVVRVGFVSALGWGRRLGPVFRLACLVRHRRACVEFFRCSRRAGPGPVTALPFWRPARCGSSS